MSPNSKPQCSTMKGKTSTRRSKRVRNAKVGFRKILTKFRLHAKKTFSCLSAIPNPPQKTKKRQQKIEGQKSIFQFATHFAKKRTTLQGDVARAPHRCHSIRRGLTNKTWYHVYQFSPICDIKLSETNNTPTRVHRKRHHFNRAATPRRRVVRQ